MHVDGFDDSDSGDFGAIEAALHEARVSGGTTPWISATSRTPAMRRRGVSAGVSIAADPRGARVLRTDPSSVRRVAPAPRGGMRAGVGPGYWTGVGVGTMLPGGVPGVVPFAPSIGPTVDVPLDTPLDIPLDVPLGPPSLPDAGGSPTGGGEAVDGGLPAAPDEGEDSRTNGDAAAKEGGAAASGPWYAKPWPWVLLAAVLGGAIVYFASRKRRPVGLGGLRERIHSAKLIVPDLKAGLYYAWKGGNAVCVYDKDGAELVCFSTTEPTIQAARDLARKKIQAYHEPGQERWLERDPRFA
jgi:hypothetical protein